MRCRKPGCPVEGVTYGHVGLCATHYDSYKAHQRELSKISDEARQQRDARTAHPAGKRRHIRLVRCECSSPVRPCPVHRDEPMWEAIS